jgi:hypothetical protein
MGKGRLPIVAPGGDPAGIFRPMRAKNPGAGARERIVPLDQTADSESGRTLIE